MKIISENRRFALFGGLFEKTKKLREQINYNILLKTHPATDLLCCNEIKKKSVLFYAVVAQGQSSSLDEIV